VSNARKPVIVRKLTRDWSAGYAVSDPGQESTGLELLDSAGKLIKIDWNQIKWVCYVRELFAAESASNDSPQPERLQRRKFTSRPRIAGLWLRLVLVDGDELEGVAANDRSLVDGAGLLLTPPDTRSNTQRVFVPRSAIRDFTVLGVIQPPARTRPRLAPGPRLFEAELFPNDPLSNDLFPQEPVSDEE
jgi:hypothetical protein